MLCDQEFERQDTRLSQFDGFCLSQCVRQKLPQ